MVAPPLRCQCCVMAEVVIAFRRPPSLSASQLRAWVRHFTLTHQSRLTLGGPEPGSDGLRLRLELDDNTVEIGEGELSDLMTDMRLLGLRPAVVPSGW
jgi:hypothetical protein